MEFSFRSFRADHVLTRFGSTQEVACILCGGYKASRCLKKEKVRALVILLLFVWLIG